jgi:hypothetical protein
MESQGFFFLRVSPGAARDFLITEQFIANQAGVSLCGRKDQL